MTLVPPDPVGSADALDPSRPEPAVGRAEQWHVMLLELAGRIPDDLLSQARLWLAEGDYDNVALAVAVASITAQAPVTVATADLILTQLFTAGEDLDQLPPLDVVAEEFWPDPFPWIFVPALIDSFQAFEDGFEEEEEEILLDLTVPGAGETLDRMDAAAVTSAASLRRMSALWRTWRYDLTMSFPQRIFIGFAEPGTDADVLPLLTANLQAALIDAGAVHPQVELCLEGAGAPDYQNRARANAALLWATESAPPPTVARPYDGADPDHGPWFAPDHPTVDDEDERRRILTYLRTAQPVLTTTETMIDVVVPEEGDVVPLTCRTDGRWVWPDMIAYYLERYRLAPESDLLAHIRAAPAERPVISAVTLHRALAALQRGDDGEPR